MRKLIDFGQPVGLLMVTVLHFVPDYDDPAASSPGSRPRSRGQLPGYLARHLRGGAGRGGAGGGDLHQDVRRRPGTPARTREILRFFDGFDLVEPGLVYLPLWRPDGPVPDHPERAWFYAGVGRKG